MKKGLTERVFILDEYVTPFGACELMKVSQSVNQSEPVC